MLSKLKRLAKKIPWIKSIFSKRDFVPKGHFYSPIPSINEVKSRESSIWGILPKSIPSIDLNIDKQVELLQKIKPYYGELPFGEEQSGDTRYYFDNSMFCYADAIILYGILRNFKPKKVIEIGSGFSSAIMLDTNDLFLNGSLVCTFIEPYPERLHSLLRPKDKSTCRIIQKPVQDVDLAVFDQLEAGDILFVDSSHVSKIGSDVNRIMFDILPRLASGVIVHFHDVFFPFEYPKIWIEEGRAWNEAYLVHAFLQYNSAFEIIMFNSYMGTYYSEWMSKNMPLCLKNTGASIWMQKK